MVRASVLVLLALTWSALPSFIPAGHAAPAPTPSPHARLSVVPANARVFAGERMAFRTTSAGDAHAGTPVWSLEGEGTIDASGLYGAPSTAGVRAFVIAAAPKRSAAATVTVVAPPRVSAALAVVSCYDGGSIDVRDARRDSDAFSDVGTASIGDVAAGVAVDAAARMAYVASGDRIASFDLKTARFAFSSAVAGARFSEVAALGRSIVATDNDADDTHSGVRVFSTDGGAPSLVASAVAGDTPEGIAVSSDRQTLYVTNVNSNSVMRFTFDGRSLRRTGSAQTGHRPFGVAIDDTRHRLFVADNDTPTLSGSGSKPGLEMFALPSMRRIARATTGSPNALPLGIAVDPAADRVFVTNEGDGDVVAYTASHLRRVGTAATGRTPWLPSLGPGDGLLYVPNALDDAVWVLDERSLRTVARAIPVCGYPTSIGIMPARNAMTDSGARS